MFPQSRKNHESALIGDELHLFGGVNKKLNFLPRSEIWTCNVREKKWTCRQAEGTHIPPSCEGAQCVVIDGIIYSYGGKTNAYYETGFLGELYGLDPIVMKWIKAETPALEMKPQPRAFCCLWAIGGRLIMFGGKNPPQPHDSRHGLLSCFGYGVNNELYEFKFGEGRDNGYWLDVELSGEPPQPRHSAAMVTVDEHRGLLHGGIGFDDAFVLNLREKAWIGIVFTPKPSARGSHRLCRLEKRGFEEKNFFVMIGGIYNLDCLNSGYIVDLDGRKVHAIDMRHDIAPIFEFTLHCVSNQDGTAEIIHSGGFTKKRGYKPMMETISLGPANDSFMKIEPLLVPRKVFDEPVQARGPPRVFDAPRPPPRGPPPRGPPTESEPMIRHLHLDGMRSALQARYDDLQESSDCQNLRYRDIESDLRECKEKCSILEAEKVELASQCQTVEAQCQSLTEEKSEMEWRHRIERRGLRGQLRTLQDSLEEAQRSLNEFVEILSIAPQQIQLTDEKLGTGSYADVYIGCWHGMHVAVKKFHELITTDKTVPLFRNEVLTLSKLHHPNIVRTCGAIMSRGVPFQIVSELLEGSVSELMDAAHSSLYLSTYEQLSISLDMTSALAYMHGLSPRPYIHGDIRPTNVLVTREMKAKLADLGAAHLVDSSKSAGPLSPSYLPPERLPPSSARSSLRGDVYSLGVSLIEIFTGLAPVQEERSRQLSRLMSRARLHEMCSNMIAGLPRVEDRPTSVECLTILGNERDDCIRGGSRPMRRLVKGEFRGEGPNRRHNVVLLDVYI
ncbi:uncharacterized protein [Oscarella lobularis]